jgi:hypothetical protein
MRRYPYITASEINSFVYCERAWNLERNGAMSSLGDVRADGTSAHRTYGLLVQASGRNRRISLCLAAIAVALLAAVVMLLK